MSSRTAFQFSIFILQFAVLLALAPRAEAQTPSVTVSAASGLGIGTATLNGTMVNTNGSPAGFFFLWGTNDYGGTSTDNWTVVNCGPATNGQSVSTNLTGLLYGQRYWYRAFATNASGGAWSPTATNFLTLAPLKATGGTVTNYTQNGTNFRAHIFPTVGTTSLTVSTEGKCEVLVVRWRRRRRLK